MKILITRAAVARCRSLPGGVRVVGPLCGHCVEREAVAVDEETLVPICEECRSDAVSDPEGDAQMSVADRVLRAVFRDPGCTVSELVVMLEDANIRTRSLSQMLSRLCAAGLMRADGPRMARRYYVDELRSADSYSRTRISCKQPSTIDDSPPRTRAQA